MLGDIGNIVNEEDEKNNWVSVDFARCPYPNITSDRIGMGGT